MAKNLVIVESPAKAKTIEKFLGKDFSVKSCFGHIRDLPNSKLSIDVEKDFAPAYEVPADKKKVVQELKKTAKGAELVWLASDEDREGEAISWHLSEVLDVKPEKLRRIVFHEITKPAIEEAVKNPRNIDLNLVNAQQARRVIDRLVGYEVSPVLWRKVKPSLSAGRVQSVAVRLIVEREKEIRAFNAESSFRVQGHFLTEANQPLLAELNKRPKSEEEVRKILSGIIDSEYKIQKVEKKPAKRSSAAPFTTSTLQQEASRKLGYSVSQTMMVAQKLYEAGKITYMRTDSVNLSKLAVDAAAKEIKSQYGEKYSNPRNFTTKSKGAQEAHEAIRPTYLEEKQVEGSNQEQKLYELIWKRTIASQMSDAQLERTVVNIVTDKLDGHFTAKGEVIVFDGFLTVYMESTDQEETEEQSGMLPKVSEGEMLNSDKIVATEKFSLHPPRYTEASLVRKLEELGIGRPSTYAPTISTIQKRGYVVKESRDGQVRNISQISLSKGEIKEESLPENYGFEKNKMFPTDIGIVVNDFLIEHFDTILSYGFTAEIEQHFDLIANGQEEWNDIIGKFYKPFKEKVDSTMEQAERAKGERILGEDPKTGKQISVRIGRYGPMAQIGTAEEEDKPRFASLLKTQSIETITLEEVLELFKLPRVLGNHDGKEITTAIGRFGPYVKYEGKFASIPKDMEVTVFDITLKQAIELIEAKKKADKERVIATFKEDENLQVLNGRYGPYIKFGKKNFRIPKTEDPKKLSFEDCMALVEKKK